MDNPTNLTERISYLCNHKKNLEVNRDPQRKQPKLQRPRKSTLERKFATDYFMLFVYSLLAIAIVSQFILIVWLDFI